MEYVDTIREYDVGKHVFRGYLVQNFLGRITPSDVGKRVYRDRASNVVQVENQDQLRERMRGPLR